MITETASIDVDHDRDRRFARSRLTLRAITIAPIGVDRDHRNRRDYNRDLADLAQSVDRDRDRRDCDRDLADRDRADCDRDLTEKMTLCVLFVILGMNDIMCLFGN